MPSKKKIIKQQQKKINDLQRCIRNIQEVNGVLTGSTWSYNAMRNLVEEICKKLENFGAPRYALDYRIKAREIDKVA